MQGMFEKKQKAVFLRLYGFGDAACDAGECPSF